MGHKLPVIEKGKMCKGRRGILRILLWSGYVRTETLRSWPLPSPPVSVHTFAVKGIDLCNTAQIPPAYLLMPAHAVPEAGKRCALLKGQVHQLKIGLCRIRCLKALYSPYISGQRGIPSFFGGQDYKPFFPFALLSSIHASSRRFEYPCPLNCPDTHRQSMYI